MRGLEQLTALLEASRRLEQLVLLLRAGADPQNVADELEWEFRKMRCVVDDGLTTIEKERKDKLNGWLNS